MPPCFEQARLRSVEARLAAEAERQLKPLLEQAVRGGKVQPLSYERERSPGTDRV
jgi:hypothetical protein